MTGWAAEESMQSILRSSIAHLAQAWYICYPVDAVLGGQEQVEEFEEEGRLVTAQTFGP